MKRKSYLGLKLVISFCIALFLWGSITTPAEATYYMRVTYVLWGQGAYGDCIFIELPGVDGTWDTSDDKNVLIDGGYRDTKEPYSKLDEFLTAKGIDGSEGNRINYMVMSHPGADHYYGLYMVVRGDADGMNLPVDYFYEVLDYSALDPDRPIYDALKSHLSGDGTTVYNPDRGNYLSGPSTNCGPSWDSNLVVRCLSANEATGGGNETSMVLKVSLGSSTFIFGGDLPTSEDLSDNDEGDLVTNYSSLEFPINIYKVHHHGSDGSSGASFLSSLSPKYAVQQDGGTYATHPYKVALDRITDAGAIIYRNDLDGDVLIKCDDAGNYDITREVCYPTLPWDGFSNEDTNGIYAPPALPTNLSVTSTTASSVTLDWDDVSGATYDVFRSTISNGDNGAGRHTNPGCDAATGIYKKIAEDVAVSNYTDNTVTEGTTYYYRVSSKKVETDGEGYQYRYERRYSNQASGIPSGGSGEEVGEGCFIATASYGTPMASEVKTLSTFRDEYLLTNKTGQALVKFYYRHSPRVANFIRDKEPLKAIVRTGLKPLVWGAERVTH